MLELKSEPEQQVMSTTGMRAALTPFPRRAVRRAIEYIYANLAADIRLADIAGAAGLSTFHFARVFRKTTGMTPHRYLIQARVGKVKELLRESELSLAAIADEAGFSDQSHMSKVFRSITGVTPKTFRNGCKVRTADQSFESFRLLRTKMQKLRTRYPVLQT
jgi:AraC family transcriptional regulator